MKDDVRLLAFGLGTFHTALLVLVLVLPLYLAVDLGELLSSLDTVVGLAAFAVLWGISVYCTYRGLRDAGLEPAGEVSARALLSSGSVWGSWNGMLFFWVLLAAGAGVLFVVSVQDGGGSIVGVIVFAIVAWGVGTVLSAPIGAFIGTVFTAIDLVLLSVARRLAGVHE